MSPPTSVTTTAEAPPSAEPSTTAPALPPLGRPEVIGVAVALTAILLGFDFRYGYQRDELYFRLLGDHLSWGYFDQPALAPALGWLTTNLFGDTLWALRMTSALALGAFALLVGLLARELGGGRRVQLLATFGAAASPWALSNTNVLVTNSFDMAFWMAVILFAARALRRGDGRWWLAAGLAAGLATYNKYLIVILGGALLISLAAVGPRRALADRWLWLGVALAAVVASPNLAYQLTHDLPQLTMAESLADDRGDGMRVAFVQNQFLFLGIWLAPLWLAGWVWLWRDRTLRAFAVAYPVAGIVVFMSGGRADYIFGLLVMLFVAGCVAARSWLAAARWRRVLLGAALSLHAATALLFGLSVLPLDVVADTPIPSMNAQVRDSIGWPEFTSQLAEVYHALPPADRAQAVVLVGNYGEAGALHRYGPEYGLPEVYSGHNELHRLGPPPESATVAVVVGDTGLPESLRATAFASCEPTGQRIDNAAGVDNDEVGREILVCRDPTAPWSQLWPSFLHSRHYG